MCLSRLHEPKAGEIFCTILHVSVNFYIVDISYYLCGMVTALPFIVANIIYRNWSRQAIMYNNSDLLPTCIVFIGKS